jgi:hypothetical protein
MTTIREDLSEIKEVVVRTEEHVRGIDIRLDSGTKRMNGLERNVEENKDKISEVDLKYAGFKWHGWVLKALLVQGIAAAVAIIGWLIDKLYTKITIFK